MMRATVVGEVWATRKAPGLQGRKLLLLAGEDGRRVVVGIDTLDARNGDQVLVAWGSGARSALAGGPQNTGTLADAAVSLVIDDPSRDAEKER